MNKVELSGHVGKDPEVTYLPDGKQLTKLTLATSNDYKGKDGNWVKKPASWHNLIAYGKIAEMLAEAKKGSKLQVEGKIQYRDWSDKSGNKRTTTEIVVFVVNLEVTKAINNEEDVPF